jgi:cytochrome c biogenesis protein ResB
VRRLLAIAASLRTTAAIMAVLAGLLLLNVVLPQVAVDAGAHAQAVQRGPVWRFVLVGLGLGSVASSPPFLLVMGLFFVNLVVVLADRTRSTILRLRARVPSGTQFEALLEDAVIVEGPFAAGEGRERVRTMLATLGHRVVDVDERRLWAVRHRFALLGFPLFHAAFLLIAAGGILLYLTRDVVTLIAAEGQEVDSGAGVVERRAPLGAQPSRRFVVDRVDVSLEDGKPTALSAALSSGAAGGDVQLAAVNRPAVWGDLTVLVTRAGVAPVLWLLDRQGFTLDRVAVPAVPRGGLPTRIPFGALGIEAVIEPIAVGPGFPTRDQLATVPIRLRLRQGERDVFEGALRAGEGVDVGAVTVRLQEVRYWAGLVLVSERGGASLISGFVLAVVGIAWRMIWHRREVVVEIEEGRLRIGGRSERYPAAYRAELMQLRDLLASALGPEEGR